jgi:hypothetical protein
MPAGTRLPAGSLGVDAPGEKKSLRKFENREIVSSSDE